MFIPIACGVAGVLTCVLGLETAKGTAKTMERRRRRHARRNRP